MGCGFTREEAASLGAPTCPRCGRLADGMARLGFPIALPQPDVVVARCTPCRLYTIIGSDEPWIEAPMPGKPGVTEFVERLNRVAMTVHDRPETEAMIETKRRLMELERRPVEVVVR